jgi:hypothetical protein
MVQAALDTNRDHPTRPEGMSFNRWDLSVEQQVVIWSYHLALHSEETTVDAHVVLRAMEVAKESTVRFSTIMAANHEQRDEVTYQVELTCGFAMEMIQGVFGEQSILHNWGVQLETEVVCQ